MTRLGLAVVVFLCAIAAQGQQAGQIPATAISSTGLLPIYGADLALERPETLQQAWTSLAPLGAGVVRFDVDVRDPAAVDALADTCAWAAGTGVKIVPVLIGANAGEPLPAAYASQAAGFVTALAQALRGGDPARAAAYQQILAFQLGRAMNDPARHGGMPRETALLRLLQAARAIRKAEEPLAAAGIAATPIMIDVSFDAVLIAGMKAAGAGIDLTVPLSDASYTAALAPLAAFVTEAASSADFDLIAVEYLPGTSAPGDESHLARLARDLAAPAQGKKLVVVTGMQEGAGFANDQRRFYALAFANLADQRASEGPDSALAGVLFKWALDDPAREALTKVAESVDAARAETPPADQPPDTTAVQESAAGDPALVSAAKDKVQQFLLGLLDRSLEKVGSSLMTTGDVVPAEPPPVDPPAEAPQLQFGDVTTTPNNPVAGSPLQLDALVYN
jgi:hypothetical protein